MKRLSRIEESTTFSAVAAIGGGPHPEIPWTVYLFQIYCLQGISILSPDFMTGRKEEILEPKPYSFEIVDGISIVRFNKVATASEVSVAMDEVAARGVTRRRLWIYPFGGDADSSELKTIAQKGVDIWPVPSKSATVAPDDLTFALARMHDMYREHVGFEVRVFREEQDAIAWLKREE